MQGLHGMQSMQDMPGMQGRQGRSAIDEVLTQVANKYTAAASQQVTRMPGVSTGLEPRLHGTLPSVRGGFV